MNVRMGHDNRRSKNYEPIKFTDALDFKEQFNFPASVSIFTYATGIATAKYESEKTNPNVTVIGTDENYMITSGNEIDKGRVFTQQEVNSGSHVAIVGSEIVSTLFKKNEDPIDKVISVGPGKYRIIGVIEEKGTGFGFTPDRQVLLPINNVRQYFARPNMSFPINVMTENTQSVDAAVGEATGLMRVIRKNNLYEENDFDISKSDQLLTMFTENTSKIAQAALWIGAITLLGAAIGLMNIMLVSVTERTREIGIRKSLGATKKTIRNQFLAESIVIGQLGGICGIIFGIIIGNIVSLLIGSSFIIPWDWILIGVVLCLIVALLSGIIPAQKAANLDPIESLRYE
jgi:putative ABC transport system permease protein